MRCTWASGFSGSSCHAKPVVLAGGWAADTESGEEATPGQERGPQQEQVTQGCHRAGCRPNLHSEAHGKKHKALSGPRRLGPRVKTWGKKPINWQTGSKTRHLRSVGPCVALKGREVLMDGAMWMSLEILSQGKSLGRWPRETFHRVHRGLGGRASESLAQRGEVKSHILYLNATPSKGRLIRDGK